MPLMKIPGLRREQSITSSEYACFMNRSVPHDHHALTTEAGDGFWRNVLQSLEAEPRTVRIIRGASGIDHPVLAAGVDDSRRRLIVVSADIDCRTAALAQADIQGTMQNVQVLTIRPLVWTPNEPTRARVSEEFPSEKTRSGTPLKRKGSSPKTVAISEIVGAYIPVTQILQSLSLHIAEMGVEYGRRERGQEEPLNESDKQRLIEMLRLKHAIPLYHMAEDLKVGICPLPLNEFSLRELEDIQRGSDVDQMREILRAKGALQYFFPAADQLALGLIDRNQGSSEVSNVAEQVLMAPQIGHPFGPPEITTTTSVPEMIRELHDRGLIADGEIGYEITPQGKTFRATVRFKPREGLVSKILNRVSITLGVKDLLGYWIGK